MNGMRQRKNGRFAREFGRAMDAMMHSLWLELIDRI